MRDGRRGALVISLDFELRWGVRDQPWAEDYRDNLLGARRAVPAILRTFAEFGAHATWATVGLLFCESKREMLQALPLRRPAYTRRGLSPYEAFDDVGENEREDPVHFALSLIRRIADTPHQEVGTHTFSHYYCLEAGQSEADFREDLRVAVQVAREKIGQGPQSIVFPRNQYSAAYTAVCSELGLVAYRGNPSHWAYRARRDEDESWLRRGMRLADAYVPLTGRGWPPLDIAERAPVDVPATRYLRPYAPALRHLEPLRLRRIVSDLRQAARLGGLFHLWWHPHDFGSHLQANLSVLRSILTCFTGLREAYGMESLSMAEAANRALGAGEPRLAARA